MEERPWRLFFVAGEASGDTHAAALMEHLITHADPPGVRFEGLGGPAMAALGGPDLEDWTDQAAVVGLVEVLKHYRYFRNKLDETIRRVRDWKPAAVVLVDYPGFNLRLAKALRQNGYAGRLIYYISPQVWAWNRGRIPQMAQWLDLMLCIFPFEKALFEASGLETIFVGHPLVDRLAPDQTVPRDERLVGLFPGSREREVSKHFPIMLESACLLRDRDPRLRFETAAATPRLADKIRALSGPFPIEVGITSDGTHGLMRRAIAGVVASGTATLEAACLGLPYCLMYRVAWPTYWVGKAVVKVPFLGIVNILAEREVVREFIQGAARPQAIANELWHLCRDGEARARLQAELAAVVAMLGDPGSHRRAAEAIVTLLQKPRRTRTVPGLHP